MLYCDTDSAIDVQNVSENKKVKTGDYLGDITDEFERFGAGCYIEEFVSGGIFCPTKGKQGCCLSPILFNLYSDWLTKEALDGLGDFNIGGQIIQTVKCADDLALMSKEETVLQSMIDKLIEVGRRYGMEMNVGKKIKVMRISRQPSPVTIMIGKKNLTMWTVLII